ncbi:MAG TPA: pyrimidine 5'-nucleotidase [Anaerolineaceae bacterium]|nr:pyrimidine 5'-nucleotidase [Anaerolineaceae bacterium]
MTSSPIRAFFVDLDDTVYPASAGVWPIASQRMVTYMHEVLGIPLAEAPALRERLFRTYGTTLRGLQREYGVDMDDYLHYVHDLDLPSLLQPDAELRQALLQLPQPKWIFTNASREHAQNVLNVMQVAECFAGIIDIRDVQPYCKPDPAAYQIALKLAGNYAPQETLMVDDRKENLDVAASLGFRTVLISPQPQNGYRTLPRLADLPSLDIR